MNDHDQGEPGIVEDLVRVSRAIGILNLDLKENCWDVQRGAWKLRYDRVVALGLCMRMVETKSCQRSDVTTSGFYMYKVVDGMRFHMHKAQPIYKYKEASTNSEFYLLAEPLYTTYH